MVNCNPETVSTDYDTSDRLYFEPLTVEDVLEVVAAEQESARQGGGEVVGVARAARRPDAAAPRAGAQGRRRPDRRHQPRGDPPRRGPRRVRRGARRGRAAGPALRHSRRRTTRRKAIAEGVGYPVLVRPSYVLGGRGMEIVYSDEMLVDYVDARRRSSAPTTRCSSTGSSRTPSRSTSTRCTTASELYLAGVMEHIEEAGIHSGDSACALPPITLGRADLERIRTSTAGIAARRRRARPAQRAVRPEGRRPLRPRGQPARQPHRAVRRPRRRRCRSPRPRRAIMLGATDRRAAGRGHAAGDRRRRRPAVRRADLGEGGGAAVRPVPHLEGGSTPSSARR